ncbi:hypothetical protein H257_19294 [Aphanomyces astaci]|uniref:Peptidase C1A papain C-terminal domain-containing protein n=1 Tax=Aphanomyces astaci TaxID=112090 RepID=W4F8G9_APHAT|nr:hypothetical protein H257_19294 [Aphanomyces astaci]ETV63775.1 hypothetical protein H257_19294 [Aphanomyces astaci]|eukprot:XP_009846741.1 hypothetical protein H257_19294 [Aphanomyces astaci]
MRVAFALSALAAKQSVVSLIADERLSLEQELAEWKAEFRDEQVDAELQRILDSKFSVEGAALTNPDATFDWRNHFALLSNDEFKKYVAVSFGRGSHLRGEIIDTLEDETASLQATSKDWTTSGCVNAVQNQGSCGSCWSFSSVCHGSVHCIKTGTLLKLAEQQYAIHYAASGLCLSSAYPYTSGSTGQTGACKSCTKQALAIGSSPVSVTVEAGNNVWKNYKSGVMSVCL